MTQPGVGGVSNPGVSNQTAPSQSASSQGASSQGASSQGAANQARGGADGQRQESNLLPSVSIPRGGGAIRGIGEKFTANPVNGSGSMAVPLALSPGRSGFGPQLSLAYDSGAGNGPFGFGWSLSLPRLSRKTDKGVPQYRDAEESDVFLLTDAEDLVPMLLPNLKRHEDPSSVPGFVIHRYVPRVEGTFARIERWTETATGDVHWRSITRENVTTIYGLSGNSRIFDPNQAASQHPRRVYEWLICETYDDRGNAVVYEYAAENDVHVNRMRASEQNRVRTANRYLKRIRYGNRVSRLIEPDLSQAEWLFEVVFDYDEDHYAELPLDPALPEAEQHRFAQACVDSNAAWRVRPDPFSVYRSGFEVRSYRRCRRVLMFHRFPELGPEPCLVRATELEYDDLVDYGQDPTPSVDVELSHQGSTRYASFLRRVVQSGYVRDETRPVEERNGLRYVTYLQSSFPALSFEYSKAQIHDAVRELDAESRSNLPVGVDGNVYQWVDLDGEGISGILTKQGGAWQYKANLGDGKFGAMQTLRTQPALFARAAGGEQLLDLSGDGQLDVVAFTRPAPGFYERTLDFDWEPFRPLRRLPDIRWDDPNTRFVDLSGDGRADVLVTESEVLTWYPSLDEGGFDAARQLRKPRDEEQGPRLVFADGTQSIYVADMTGDGLSDLVRIRNGEACYWPNLGYGRFGSKVSMDNAPRFDRSDLFDQTRLRLADIDGSGTNDILYLGRDGIRIYFNQAGNAWSEARELGSLPLSDQLSAVTTADVLGTGTACLVFCSGQPAHDKRPLRYVDLMGGQKPHLLTKFSNQLGTETRVDYAPSTKFYLDDKRQGRPWVSRLPFPVHVVERVTTHDHISGNRFTTSYAYHHGHFDGVEREFRGFGMVEQLDTEEFASFEALADPEATNVDAASHVPPVLTKTWFHTGVHIGREHISDYFAGLLDATDSGEYYREPGLTDAQAKARLLPDTVLPEGLTPAEQREACRALKGSMLRREVYALDAGPDASAEAQERAATPYSVVEQNFTLELVQPRQTNRHAVFFTHPREVLTNHYERNPADPRINHALTLEVDAFGNVLRSLAVAYARQSPASDAGLTASDIAKQSTPLITYTESSYTQNQLLASSEQGHHRAPLPAETRTYQLTGFAPEGGAARFSFDEWTRNGFSLLESAVEIAYDSEPSLGQRQKRVVEHERTLYRKDDLTALSPLGEVESQALPGELYKLALTPALIAQVFTRRSSGQPDEPLLPDPGPLLEGRGSDQGGYVAWDGGFWIASGRVFFDSAADVDNPAATAALELAAARERFFVARKAADAFRHITWVEYDAHELLMTLTTDAVGNSVSAENDYRVLQPRQVTDPNRNRTAVAFDALGMVVATAAMGKPGQALGDALSGFEVNLTLSSLRAFVADPDAQAALLLGNATTRTVYDLGRYARAAQPAFAATLSRETHFEPARDAQTKIQFSFAFSDGFGREIQKKIRAEAGDAFQRLPPTPLPSGDLRPGDLIRDAQGVPVPGPAPRRWVGSGRVVFNNKGKAVKQYEPFFSTTHLYESETEVTDTGVSPVLFYDPVERVIATLRPNHTYEKVVFDPWQQTTFDVNDTVAPDADQTGDPRTDPDIQGYVRAYFEAQSPGWQTWFDERIGNGLGPAERDAAQKAQSHANSPTTAHLDVLGRQFITFVRNKFTRDGATVDERYATRVEFDIEGNQRVVRDAVKQASGPGLDELGRVVMRYAYDLLGNRIYQASMEAGERWLLADAAGKPIRAWDSRLFSRRTTYDALRRPTGLFVTQNGVERLAERTVYGESQGDSSNHRGQVYQRFDEAGVITHVAYDFRGNLLQRRRELLPTYQLAVDWQQNPVASDGSFTTSTTFDALNRPVTVTSPDGSVYHPVFNEANLLDEVEVRLRGAATVTTFVTNIEYDAKGQRTRLDYGNGATTHYDYDPLTFRLARLRTTRPANPDATASQIFKDVSVVQDLRYTYDPAGNLTRIEDAALASLFHGGQSVEPVAWFTYDAVYRLIEAAGREHVAQNAFDFAPPNGNYRDYCFVGQRANPNDLQALRNYAQRYEYDPVGNLERVVHRADSSGWTRAYAYLEDSLLEPGKKNNRLTSVTLGNGLTQIESFLYDAHGNTARTSHLGGGAPGPNLHWDHKDQLQRADLGGGGTAYYVYDAEGERVRKVIESQSGVRTKERLYLGGFEIYREYDAAGTTRRLERQSLHILDEKERLALVETQTIQNGNPISNPVPLQRYQLGNHHGSASVELDATGALISYEEYHPYGTSSFQAGRSAAEVSLKRYRHSGKERDEETGFSYHGARHYAPWLGRWLSTEPKGVSVAMNLFEYCHGNPIRFVDPNGMDPTSDQQRFRRVFEERRAADPSSAHAQTLIQAFRDTGISGGSARERFVSILGITGGSQPGPSAHFEQYTIREIGTESSPSGVGDTGFRRELRDSIQYQPDASGADRPLHRLSSDQIGHFLTAAHIGFYIQEGNNYIASRQREAAQYRAQHPYLSLLRDALDPTTDQQVQHAFETQQYESAAIGHEQIADRAFSGWGLTSTLAAPLLASPEDVTNFHRGRLDLIRVDDTQRGNSYQDLLLTWIGYRFGQHIANNTFGSREEAARWLSLMLTDQDLSAVSQNDPFYRDAQQLQTLLQQFRDHQRRIHPQRPN